MPSLIDSVASLAAAFKLVQKDLARIIAIAQEASTRLNPTMDTTPTTSKRRVSAAGRKRMAAAQRKRWAKQKKGG